MSYESVKYSTHDSNVENLQYFFSQASLYSINIFAAFIKLAFESSQNNNSDFSFIIIMLCGNGPIKVYHRSISMGLYTEIYLSIYLSNSQCDP